MEMSGFWKHLIDTQPILLGQVEKGVEPPSDLVSACNLLGEVKTFQDDCLQVVFPLINSSPPQGENPKWIGFLFIFVNFKYRGQKFWTMQTVQQRK